MASSDMLFHIDEDVGSVIRGWIVPENPLASARLIVTVGSAQEILVDASLPRPGIADLGWHHTGNVGFEINERLIPNLANEPAVSIVEFHSKNLIYRRRDPNSHLPKRLCVYDNLHIDRIKLFEDLRRRFTLYYRSVERESHETVMTLINSHYSDSVLLYGAPNYMSFHGLMQDRDFTIIAFLRNPLLVLAQRLLSTKQANGGGATPISEFVEELDLGANKEIHRAFKKATEDQKFWLGSAMTRALGCAASESPTRHSISIALERLASMHLVGVDTEFPLFRQVLSEILEADVFDPTPLENDPAAEELAERLGKMSAVTALLEDDLILYSYAKAAVFQGVKHAADMN